MSKFGRIGNALSGAVDAFLGAREAAAAVERGKRPSAKALARLGIDPKDFDGINLH